MGSEQEWKLVPVVPTEAIHVVFDGPPGHESGRFVEVETPDGRSISAGEWLKRDNGYWVLVFQVAQPPQDGRAPGDDMETLSEDASVWRRIGLRLRRELDAVEAALAEANTKFAVTERFAEAADNRRFAAEALVTRLTAERDRLAEAADYLIDRYRRCHAGKKVRDLEEAEEAYKSARSLASLPEPEKDAGK